MKVRIRYFAALKEATRLDEEVVETGAITARELYHDLQKKYGGLLKEDVISVSINRSMTTLDSPISECDEVVFIPPVAGG